MLGIPVQSSGSSHPLTSPFWETPCIMCISYCSVAITKCLTKFNSGKGMVYCESQCEGAVHQGMAQSSMEAGGGEREVTGRWHPQSGSRESQLQVLCLISPFTLSGLQGCGMGPFKCRMGPPSCGRGLPTFRSSWQC